MIVFKTNCTDNRERKFQVTFSHKNKTCTCEIWELTGYPTNELEYKYPRSIVKCCQSKKHPETISKLLLARATAKCADGDNYVYAYGRALSLKRALRVLIDRFYDSTSVEYVIKDIIPYAFDNGMFKKFMHELRVKCPNGYKAAEELQRKRGYNLNEEWHT